MTIIFGIHSVIKSSLKQAGKAILESLILLPSRSRKTSHDPDSCWIDHLDPI